MAEPSETSRSREAHASEAAARIAPRRKTADQRLGILEWLAMGLTVAGGAADGADGFALAQIPWARDAAAPPGLAARLTAERSRREMAPQRLEKIESTPGNGMVSEASNPQDLVHRSAADCALRLSKRWAASELCATRNNLVRRRFSCHSVMAGIVQHAPTRGR